MENSEAGCLLRTLSETSLCPCLFHGKTRVAVEIGTEFSDVAAAERPTSEGAVVDCALVQSYLEVELR